jgi:hypothetical protein
MLARQIARSSTARLTAGASSVGQTRLSSSKSPSLADIHPESAGSFNQRQKEFRERQKSELQENKRKELEERRSKSAATDQGGKPSSVLGSLSSSLAEQAREKEDAVLSKKAGPLTTLIYGTKEGREMERDIERSFSQVLARGKYVHSIVTHKVKPDKVDEYVKLVGEWYPKIAATPEMKVHLVGSWRTEVGDCDTFGMATLFLEVLSFSFLLTNGNSSHLGV